MNTVYEIIGWVSIPITLASVVYMVVTWRRERTLSPRSLWIPILVSSLSLLLYVRLANLEVRPLVTWLPFFAALGLGLYIGHASRVEARDDAVVAARNPWSFVLWAASFVATQLVALLAPERTDTMVGLLFAATGLTIGEQLALISARSGQLGKMRAATAAAALFLVVLFGAALAPSESHAADVSADLGDVAGMRMDDGSEVGGLPNVGVRISGVPDRTYSGSSIDVTIENRGSDTLKVRVPIGTRLYPENTGVQTMLAAGNEVIEVPPGQTVTKRIQAYCGEASDGAPSDADSFTVGEVTTNPDLLESLQEMSRRFNEPDPDRPLDTSTAQRRGVWPHTDPDRYQPPAEGEPGYDLFKPDPPGTSTEESGKGGGAVGVLNGGVAVVGTKPGGKHGGAKPGGKKGSGKGPEQGPGKGGGKPAAELTDDEKFGEAFAEPPSSGGAEGSEPGPSGDAETLDELLDRDEKKPGSGEAPASKPEGEQGGARTDDGGPTDEELSGGYQSSSAGSNGDAGETDGGAGAETTPDGRPERPSVAVGPITIKPGQYQLDTGGGTFDYDTGEKTVTYDDPNVSAGYDLDDNVGTFMTKDGKLTIDTQPGQFDVVKKDESGTTTLTGTREGDEKSLTLKHEPTDGGRDRTYSVSSGPSGITGSLESGQRTDEFHVGDDWWLKHQQPGVSWGVGGGDSGLQVSYQRQDSVKLFNEYFELTHGPTYADDQFNYQYDLEKKFDVNLFNKLNVPVKVNITGVTGPGSSQRVLIGPAWDF